MHSYGGATGSEVEHLNCPQQLAVDIRDNLLVADSVNNRVQLLSPELNYLGNIEIPGYPLDNPVTLCFDDINNRLYIGEDNGGRILVLEVA